MLRSNAALENNIDEINNDTEENTPGSQYVILKICHATFTSFSFLLGLLNGEMRRLL